LTALRRLVFVTLLALAGTASADIRWVVQGVAEPLASNVRNHLDTGFFGQQARLRPHDYDDVVDNAITKARAALRPYGFYNPDIEGRLIAENSESVTVELAIDAGPRMQVAELDVQVTGAGADDPQFREWRAAWPLEAGAALDQTAWEQAKRDAMEIASARGYLGARFTEHRLELDLEANTAGAFLTLDTGPRYVMGDVDFGEHGLKPGILEYAPRFEKGDPYTSRLVSQLRTDLWKTGYFDDINVFEVQHPERTPPVVDVKVRTETTEKNDYTGALGYGTDTGIRLQANWTRVPISSYGDRLDLGIGYQELDDEFKLRGRYQRPWRNRARQWWDTQATVTFENLDLDVKRDEEDEEAIRLATGDIEEKHLRFGRLKLVNLKAGQSQLFYTLFAQYLNSERRLQISQDDIVFDPPFELPDVDDRIKDTNDAISLGAELELINVQGRHFATFGNHEIAWIFHSNEAFGSSTEFTQLYLSSRRSYLVGDRLKFHVRAEAGYTDAEVDNFDIIAGGEAFELSLTQLPNFYRFKAGGSMSVRGYGFEQLSNNDVGSNNILTASAEVEYRFLDSWSAALFADIGNAFNDWRDPDLKRGVGIGIRWYSIVGEVRVDVAQALDFDDEPWRLHITIGTPLL
jgi:translocation and assembly module TamA